MNPIKASMSYQLMNDANPDPQHQSLIWSSASQDGLLSLKYGKRGNIPDGHDEQQAQKIVVF